MEKRRPHYDLAAVQSLVVKLGAAAFTKTALDGGFAITLREGAVVIQFKEK